MNYLLGTDNTDYIPVNEHSMITLFKRLFDTIVQTDKRDIDDLMILKLLFEKVGKNVARELTERMLDNLNIDASTYKTPAYYGLDRDTSEPIINQKVFLDYQWLQVTLRTQMFLALEKAPKIGSLYGCQVYVSILRHDTEPHMIYSGLPVVWRCVEHTDKNNIDNAGVELPCGCKKCGEHTDKNNIDNVGVELSCDCKETISQVISAFSSALESYLSGSLK